MDGHDVAHPMLLSWRDQQGAMAVELKRRSELQSGNLFSVFVGAPLRLRVSGRTLDRRIHPSNYHSSSTCLHAHHGLNTIGLPPPLPS